MNSRSTHKNSSSNQRFKGASDANSVSAFSLRSSLFKKLISIGFLILFLTPTLITYYSFHYRSSSIQEEVDSHIEKGMEENELILLKFSHEETETLLRWEHAREFEYDHQMYDIVEIEAHEDSTYYWVWWDVEETALKKEFKESITDILGIKKNTTKQNTRFKIDFRSIYYIEHSTDLTLLAKEQEVAYSRIQYEVLTLFYSPPSPPPKIS